MKDVKNRLIILCLERTLIMTNETKSVIILSLSRLNNHIYVVRNQFVLKMHLKLTTLTNKIKTHLHRQVIELSTVLYVKI
jgi:hypothetical protein